MNVNIPYADVVRPLQGSENPIGDRNCFLNQNALAGHVEEQAMSDHAFKAQHPSAKPGVTVQCWPVLDSVIVFIVRVHLWSTVIALS